MKKISGAHLCQFVYLSLFVSICLSPFVSEQYVSKHSVKKKGLFWMKNASNSRKPSLKHVFEFDLFLNSFAKK
jgi:hypothetical protein